MTLKVTRISARTGYDYVLENVVQGKEIKATPYGGYVATPEARGEAPGRWYGRGAVQLGVAGRVEEEQYRRLVGEGVHPVDAGTALGRAWPQFRRVNERLAALWKDTAIDAATREQREEQIIGSPEREAAAAFDLTFSLPKDLSIIGLLGSADRFRDDLAAIQATAVNHALEVLELTGVFTRRGVNGVRQVDVDGLAAMVYDHRMSRDGDPAYHSHAVVSSKVRHVDQRGHQWWLAVDALALTNATTAARIAYERTAWAEAGRRWGVRRATQREGGQFLSPGVWSVDGMPASLVELFSKARRSVVEQTGEGGACSERAWRQRTQVARLATRPDKPAAESTRHLVQRLRAEAAESGFDVDRILGRVMHRGLAPCAAPSDEVVIAQAVGALERRRSWWNTYHLQLEIGRALDLDPTTSPTQDWARVERLAQQAIATGALLSLSPGELVDLDTSLRRASDGVSEYRRSRTEKYSTERILRAEEKLVALAHTRGAPTVPLAAIGEWAVAQPAGPRPEGDQHVALQRILARDDRIAVVVGPAGTGKTYLQRAVTQLWDGDVLGLAPGQIAARTLADSIGTRCENVAKFLYENERSRAATKRRRAADPHWSPKPGQLVIVDEAGTASTWQLLRLAELCADADAKLLLVGDDRQLDAVEGSGAFRLLARETHAAILTTVRRFREDDGSVRRWEAEASLRLRDGDAGAVAAYDRRGRIHGGGSAAITDAIYRAWAADHLAGVDALLLVSTERQATDLNARARAELVAAGRVHPDGIQLGDGTTAGVGDVIVTRRNDRRLELAQGFVANRDTWHVDAVTADGGLEAVSRQTGEQILLPAHYNAAGNVRLGYAATVHSAQGRTVDTCRVLVDDYTTGPTAYVGLTRGTARNEGYVITHDDTREGHQHAGHRSAVAVLADIIGRDTLDRSATETLADEHDTAESLATLGPIFDDLTDRAAAVQYRTQIADVAGKSVADRAAASHAWGQLVRDLVDLDRTGFDATDALSVLAAGRELDTADDVAAVLDWRLRHHTEDWQPDNPDIAELTWTDRAPEGDHPAAVAAREYAAHMDDRVTALGARTAEERRRWAEALGPIPDDPTDPARTAWERRAGIIAAYRERYDVTGDDPLGDAPSPHRRDATAAWLAGQRVLGDASVAIAIRQLPTTELECYIDRATDANQREPTYPGRRIRALSLRASDAETRAAEALKGLRDADAGIASTSHWRHPRRYAAHQRARRTAHHRLEQHHANASACRAVLAPLETAYDTWRSWRDTTANTRRYGRLAADELKRRTSAARDAESTTGDAVDAALVAVQRSRDPVLARRGRSAPASQRRARHGTLS